MAQATKANLGEVLKNMYSSEDIEELGNLSHPALNECAAEGSVAIGGQNFIFAVRTEVAGGHAYISETGDLPTANVTRVKQASVAPTVHAGVVEVSGLAQAISSANTMAFARALEENLSSTIAEMTAYKEGTIFRDGTGLLTQFNGNPGTTGAFTVDDVGYLREGMLLDVVDNTTTSTHHNSNVKVSAVDWANKTVTLGTAIAAGVADNDRLYLADSQVSGSALQTLEPLGLAASVATSNSYLGIDRTASGNHNWQAQTLAVSSFLDEAILLRARTRLMQEVGNDIGAYGAFKLLTHPMQADTLFKLAIPRIDFTPGGQWDLGNSVNPSFGGIRLVCSGQAPPGTAYLGDFSKHISVYTPNGKLHVDTQYNGSSMKWLSRKDVGLVFLKEYCQFINKKPRCFISLTSLTEQTR